MSRRHGPPATAGLLAKLLLSRADAERLLGDLDEEYQELQRVNRGRVGADLWYWRQVLSSIRALRSARAAASRGAVVESLCQDLRYAFRGLRRSPTFAVAATLTLGLGIGATTAIFSVVHAVLLRSLPYAEAERIVRAWDNTRDGDTTEFSFRVVEYRELRRRTDVFEAVGAEFPISSTLLMDGQEPRQVPGRMVTPDFFRVFGVEPHLGRMFTAEEIAAGDRLVAVVTHGFWARYLGSDPAAVGRAIDVDGHSFTLLGVLPETYAHISGSDAQLFIPYTIGTSRWSGHWLDLYGRLRPGISLDRAAEEIDAVLVAVGDSDRASNRWFATVESLHDMVVGDARAPIWAVMSVVTLVLLLACVNVANLTLARSTSRAGEIAVRRSLGAGHGRLLRQLLVENLAVAAVGGGVGIAVAWAFLGFLVRLAPASIPRMAETGLHPAVLGFCLLVSAATALVFGLGPAVRLLRRSPVAIRTDRGGTGDRRFHRLLGGLVVVQVALALTLLVAAGLTVRTLQYLQREELGFDRARAATFRVSVSSSRYPSGADTHAFYTRLLEALRALPGVTAVGAASDLPVSGEGAVATVTSDERAQAGKEGVTVLQRRATAGLFRALGTPLRAGREFDSRDRRNGEAVVIVSESLARALFGNARTAVGRRIGWGGAPEAGDWMTVVGVVADVVYEDVARAPDPQVYQAHAQSATRQMAVVVRTRGDPLEILAPARAALRSIDARIPVYSVGTLGGLVDMALAGRRFTTSLFGLFAALALALTVAGLYGVLAFAVGRRRREIGVRMAVGAPGSRVAALVLGRGMKLIALGLAAGAVGALVAGRLLRGLLVGVGPYDPATFALVVTVVIAVGASACVAPALGASRVDPAAVLRDE